MVHFLVRTVMHTTQGNDFFGSDSILLWIVFQMKHALLNCGVVWYQSEEKISPRLCRRVGDTSLDYVVFNSFSLAADEWKFGCGLTIYLMCTWIKSNFSISYRNGCLNNIHHYWRDRAFSSATCGWFHVSITISLFAMFHSLLSGIRDYLCSVDAKLASEIWNWLVWNNT